MRRPNFTLSVKAKKRLLQIFIGLAIVYFSIDLQEQAWPIWISSG